jgi:hypothetical protein
MNGNGKDQSTDRAQFVATPGPGPTQEQLADMPSAQLPPPAPARNWDEILQNAAPKYTGQPGGQPRSLPLQRICVTGKSITPIRLATMGLDHLLLER